MSSQARPTKVLIVEDDPNIVDLIRSNLAVRGFDTVLSTDGSKVLTLLDTEQPDMVLLDLMLPFADGFELCRQIRERSPVAIIVVSARGGERDKVTALNMGADDYMTKPFGIEELLARILATLRRTRPTADVAAEAAATVITIGDVQLDLASQQVRVAGEEVHLTPTEFALLRELAVNRGKLLSRTHLLRRVWGHGYETETGVRPGLHPPPTREARGPWQPAADRDPAARRVPHPGRVTTHSARPWRHPRPSICGGIAVIHNEQASGRYRTIPRSPVSSRVLTVF